MIGTRIGFALAFVAAAACSKGGGKVDSKQVVSYLSKASPSERARLVAEAEAAAHTERTDLIGRDGNALTLVGDPPKVGDAAPAFTLVGKDKQPIALSDYKGKTLLLSVVPSIDTRICELQTHRVTDEEPNLPDGVAVLTVSRDLPFAQTRFIEEAQIQTTMASDFKGGTFGRDWNLEVKETGLLARSLWVIGRDGKIAYRELVPDQGTEPDYEPALAALRQAAGAP